MDIETSNRENLKLFLRYHKKLKDPLDRLFSAIVRYFKYNRLELEYLVPDDKLRINFVTGRSAEDVCDELEKFDGEYFIHQDFEFRRHVLVGPKFI
jgi:hypothetical protein